MSNPCDICLDEKCGGKRDCNCDTCKVKADCPRKLNATIRITTKCTQTCSHCCFSCSPKESKMMSVETAKIISDFNKNNNVITANIMGGEIICNPDWKEILEYLIPSVKLARIISNGDWSITNPEFAEFLSKFDNCYVSISKDVWHTNKNIELAEELLKKFDVICNISDLNETEENMMPVGRSMYNYGMYSMFGCYCSNELKKYSFLIDESGDIYKCAFGIWDYADVKEYQNGGFRDRFKEFNSKFYKIFISNCKRCSSYYNQNKDKPENKR